MTFALVFLGLIVLIYFCYFGWTVRQADKREFCQRIKDNNCASEFLREQKLNPPYSIYIELSEGKILKRGPFNAQAERTNGCLRLSTSRDVAEKEVKLILNCTAICDKDEDKYYTPNQIKSIQVKVEVADGKHMGTG